MTVTVAAVTSRRRLPAHSPAAIRGAHRAAAGGGAGGAAGGARPGGAAAAAARPLRARPGPLAHGGGHPAGCRGDRRRQPAALGRRGQPAARRLARRRAAGGGGARQAGRRCAAAAGLDLPRDADAVLAWAAVPSPGARPGRRRCPAAAGRAAQALDAVPAEAVLRAEPLVAARRRRAARHAAAAGPRPRSPPRSARWPGTPTCWRMRRTGWRRGCCRRWRLGARPARAAAVARVARRPACRRRPARRPARFARAAAGRWPPIPASAELRRRPGRARLGPGAGGAGGGGAGLLDPPAPAGRPAAAALVARRWRRPARSPASTRPGCCWPGPRAPRRWRLRPAALGCCWPGA